MKEFHEIDVLKSLLFDFSNFPVKKFNFNLKNSFSI